MYQISLNVLQAGERCTNDVCIDGVGVEGEGLPGVPKIRHSKKLIKMGCMQMLTTGSQEIQKLRRRHLYISTSYMAD